MSSETGADDTGVAVEGGEVVDGSELSVEQLEEQLRLMEEEQGKLAAELEEQTSETNRLEPHLAVIEEQFRRSFDDRFSAPAGGRSHAFPPSGGGSADQPDLMKINSVFRDVSRDMGDEWRAVFTEVTSRLPPDVVAEELRKIDRMQPIIRGYRSLNVWKELAGPDFNIRDLVHALRKNKMEDVADMAAEILESDSAAAAKPAKPVQRRKSDVASHSKSDCLDNRRMLLLSKKIGAAWEPLAQALGLPEEEVAEIKESPGSDTYQGAFKVLWSWRQTQPDIEEKGSVDILKAALVHIGQPTLAEQLGKE